MTKEYYARNRARFLLIRAEYRRENRLKLREANKDYYARNKAVIAKKAAALWKRNKTEIYERNLAWRRRNKDKIRSYNSRLNKQWWDKSGREWAKKYRVRRANDPAFRIRHNLAVRIRSAIIRGSKSASTVQLLGCSIPDFIWHLEAQFSEGMLWSNYGKWHIDHIIPCKRFDLSKSAEQKRCFRYTNLQPLWAEENRRKGARCSDTQIELL